MLKLYKQPSLVSALTVEATSQIIFKKAEHFENNEAKLKDYIGQTLNNIQTRINEMMVQKIELERDLKEAEKVQGIIRSNVASALMELGISELTDKTSLICSSIKVVDETEATTELKEVALTTTEMKDLLKANGLSVVKMEEVEIEAKPISLKTIFKRGKGVGKSKPKDINIMLDELDKQDLEDNHVSRNESIAQ